MGVSRLHGGGPPGRGRNFFTWAQEVPYPPQGRSDRSLWRWVGPGAPRGPRGPPGAHEGDLSPGHHRGRGRNFSHGAIFSAYDGKTMPR